MHKWWPGCSPAHCTIENCMCPGSGTSSPTLINTGSPSSTSVLNLKCSWPSCVTCSANEQAFAQTTRTSLSLGGKEMQNYQKRAQDSRTNHKKKVSTDGERVFS